MRYSLCSKTPCAVKLNGEYLGKSDLNLRYFDFDGDGVLHLIPFDNSLQEERIMLCECNKQNQPFKSYAFDGGYLIMPIFKSAFIPTFKNLFSFELESVAVNLFIDGYAKLFICTKQNSNIFALPFIPEKAQAELIGNNLILFIQQKEKGKLLFFSLESTPIIVNKFNCSEFYIKDDKLFITQNTNTLKGFSFLITVDKNGAILNKNTTKSAPISALSPLLRPFAFLEALLYKEEFYEFLHPDLKEHSALIEGFFGEFYNFIPLRLENQISALLLKNNLAQKVSFLLKDNLICDFSY